MYLLYIDESSTASAEGEPKDGSHSCVCGVRIVDSSYGNATTAFAKFLARWRQAQANSFEIKGHDLFHGEGGWSGTEPAERVQFCQEFAELVASLNLKLFAAMKLSEDFTDDYKSLLGAVVGRVAKETASSGSKTGRQLLVVFDQRPDFNVSHSDAMRDIRSSVIADHKSACRFIDLGYEADSRHAPLIQVADFVAYFTRRQARLVREGSLLSAQSNEAVIQAVDAILDTLKPKLVRV